MTARVDRAVAYAGCLLSIALSMQNWLDHTLKGSKPHPAAVSSDRSLLSISAARVT